ncbi:hypothetical protein YW7DRAFT_01803 [Streptomyces sp. AmelKG-E11A]|nr:hypothetical protein YW7DRAFT_01803 [Streptomyces sp. AmelKG-E11A]
MGGGYDVLGESREWWGVALAGVCEGLGEPLAVGVSRMYGAKADAPPATAGAATVASAVLCRARTSRRCVLVMGVPSSPCTGVGAAPFWGWAAEQHVSGLHRDKSLPLGGLGGFLCRP